MHDRLKHILAEKAIGLKKPFASCTFASCILWPQNSCPLLHVCFIHALAGKAIRLNKPVAPWYGNACIHWLNMPWGWRSPSPHSRNCTDLAPIILPNSLNMIPGRGQLRHIGLPLRQTGLSLSLPGLCVSMCLCLCVCLSL